MTSPAVAVALATSCELPELAASDRVLLHTLRDRGAFARPAVWTSPDTWSTFDAIVIRSCWDYHRQPDRFRTWLAEIQAAGVLVVNPPDLVRWNMHKSYLLDLERAGVRIPPTRLVARGDGRALREHVQSAGWASAVVKPAISASGYRTRKLVEGIVTAEDEQAFSIMRADGDVILQAFVPEVPDCGEWSLMFCGGRYTHAVVKVAAHGEFRVQKEWGGHVVAREPSSALAEHARRVLERFAPSATYARVDGVETADGFVLMELELIEPELFLDRQPTAAECLADAVLSAARAASMRRARSSP